MLVVTYESIVRGMISDNTMRFYLLLLQKWLYTFTKPDPEHPC